MQRPNKPYVRYTTLMKTLEEQHSQVKSYSVPSTQSNSMSRHAAWRLLVTEWFMISLGLTDTRNHRCCSLKYAQCTKYTIYIKRNHTPPVGALAVTEDGETRSAARAECLQCRGNRFIPNTRDADGF